MACCSSRVSLYLWALTCLHTLADGAAETGLATRSGQSSHNSILLVTCLNGSVVAVDAKNGANLWSTSTGPSLVLSGKSAKNGVDSTALIPTPDGSLFSYHGGTLHQLPITAKDLVDSSPSLTPDKSELILGSKTSSVRSIDILTGSSSLLAESKDVEIKDESSTSNFPSYQDDVKSSVVIARTEYHLRSIAVETGEEHWNLTFSEIYPVGWAGGVYATNMMFLNDNGYASTSLLATMGTRLQLHYEQIELDGNSLIWEIDVGCPIVTAYQLEISNADTVAEGSPLELISHPVQMNLYRDQKTPDNFDTILSANDVRSIPPNTQIREGGAHKPNSNPLMLARTYEEDWTCVTDTPTNLPEIDDSSTNARSHDTHSGFMDIGLVIFVAILSASISTIVLFNLITHSIRAILETNSRYIPSKLNEMEIIEEMDQTEKVVISKKRKRKSKNRRLDTGEDQRTVKGDTEGFRIGVIEVSSVVLGKGSAGTVVFQGKLAGRDIAVKRLLGQFVHAAKKEIEILIKSDEHPNIVRCFAMEEDNDFVYIALERCEQSLYDYVEHSKVISPVRPLEHNVEKLILLDICQGLSHLHRLDVVHRDLKPQNVLLTQTRHGLRAKLSDMGISKILDENQSSFDTLHSGGSVGWQSAEVLKNGRMSKSVDLFSLGCILYYVITGGHPFGTRFERECNIINNRPQLDAIKSRIPEGYHLVKNLVSINPKKRMPATEVPKHPFFWIAEKRLAFLNAVSDFIDSEPTGSSRQLELEARLDRCAATTIDGDWEKNLDDKLLLNLGKYRKYRKNSARDLLRVIRNKSNHFRELPNDLKHAMGPYPEGFYAYFSSRYEYLLMDVYAFASIKLSSEPMFSKFFEEHPIT